MKFNLWFTAGVVYIFFWVGIAYKSIGLMPRTEPYDWTMPLIMFGALMFPFLFGLLAGIDIKRGGGE